jgi:hypothetical protein
MCGSLSYVHSSLVEEGEKDIILMHIGLLYVRRAG